MANTNAKTAALTTASTKGGKAPAIAAPANTSFGATGVGPAPLMAASAKRYGAKAMALNPAFATRTFTLSALGLSTAGAKGCVGRNGQATVMGLTAYAVSLAANGGKAATGAAIVAVMLTHPAFKGVFNGTKANGTHIGANALTAAKWCAGYVNGLTRTQHGLAA